MASRDEEDVIHKGKKLWEVLKNDPLDRKKTVIRDLLRNGAPANFREPGRMKTSRTPLHFVVWETGGDDDLMDLLLENGADANLIDCFGCTPLHLAAEKGNLQAARALLRNPHSRADCNKRTKFGNETPLQIAERMGHQNIRTYLLKFEADGSNASSGGARVQVAAEDGSVFRVHADGENLNLIVGHNSTMNFHS